MNKPVTAKPVTAKPVWFTPVGIVLIIVGILLSIFKIHPNSQTANAKFKDRLKLFEEERKEKDEKKVKEIKEKINKLTKEIDNIYFWPWVWLVIFLFFIGIVLIFS